ncbi:MAG: DNA polymerase domain-containing protein, partial [Atribacterota bacterium]
LTLKVSRFVESYVNKKAYEQTQRIDFNSQVDDHRIIFKQEVIATSALMIAKKKYGLKIINEEGVDVDKNIIKGLEIIRSDCPEAIRPKLKSVMNSILSGDKDEETSKLISKSKKELEGLSPEEIAANIGINGINKYLSNGEPIKSTPWHVKGVYAYNTLLKELNIKNIYEPIYDKQKIKVVYVKYPRPYKFDFETVSFIKWPEEFNAILEVDYKKMIEKYFTNKIDMLLSPIGKQDLAVNKIDLDAFF